MGGEEATDDDASCWYCGGANPETCPVCCTPQAEDREEAIRKESAAVIGQDGWVCPEDADLEAQRKAASPEAYNLKLLCESESHLHNGEWEAALELSDRCCRNLELHVEACEGAVAAPGQMRPFLRRGERELLALAFAHRARCHLLKQDYRMVILDGKRFVKLYEWIVEGGNPATMHQQEKQVLNALDPGAAFMGNMPLLAAACEIANQCRERVGNGFAPKVVLEHTRKAIEGLEPLDFMVFPGLNSLRAHLYITRAHAALELERWEEAKEDAELALACDPSFKEAEYMKQSAENEEW
eukprot:CAMPEP_0179143052 /NCGR_PEP_ID=MMETSP0796-20121207/68769_1 /TAXON_ID=73915 /ORGANISM="Pyrodinium bahamense, Strain pbaha01" /LENGTH=297 /DNA_ID=CAMNT_0020843027 /DNA_START=33 /DNA_END=926 /DNA_ORIENTATION=-